VNDSPSIPALSSLQPSLSETFSGSLSDTLSDTVSVTLEMPSTLTPSKVSSFRSCPLAFRYSVIDRLPEPLSLAAFRGSLVHRALQLFYGTSSGQGDLLEHLEPAWSSMAKSEDVSGLGLSEQQVVTLLEEARSLLRTYLCMEDPSRVRAVGVELDLRAEVAGVPLHGIIDRLDWVEGRFVITDYKTGKAPPRHMESDRLEGVSIYAVLLEGALGIRPDEVRLLFLGSGEIVKRTVDERALHATKQRIGAVWKAIGRACELGDFRPHPSRLCQWCGFRSFCPVFAE
jgi:putative RecB family exonuclease